MPTVNKPRAWNKLDEASKGTDSRMNARIKFVGLGLAVAGFLFMAVGGYTYVQTQAGGASLAAYSAAENVKLTYNSDGQLADKTGSSTD